jgi:hypothetical protein
MIRLLRKQVASAVKPSFSSEASPRLTVDHGWEAIFTRIKRADGITIDCESSEYTRVQILLNSWIHGSI